MVDEIRLPNDVMEWGKVGLEYDLGTSKILIPTSKRYPPFSK